MKYETTACVQTFSRVNQDRKKNGGWEHNRTPSPSFFDCSRHMNPLFLFIYPFFLRKHSIFITKINCVIVFDFFDRRTV